MKLTDAQQLFKNGKLVVLAEVRKATFNHKQGEKNGRKWEIIETQYSLEIESKSYQFSQPAPRGMSVDQFAKEIPVLAKGEWAVVTLNLRPEDRDQWRIEIAAIAKLEDHAPDGSYVPAQSNGARATAPAPAPVQELAGARK